MAVQGFKYSLSWETDFTEVDSAPAGFTDRSARTKASIALDPSLKGRKDASTSEYYFDESSIKVSVKAVKADSWVVKGLQSDKLLKHEQMHYNISALGGRDLERKLKNLRDATVNGLIKKKEDLGKEIQTLIDKVNKDYDDALLGTNHGMKATEQSKWELHLSNLMNSETAELKSL